MDEAEITRALRHRDPQGITAVYDRYAAGLYEYCWWLLRDHGAAREALHDTLLATGVHVGALRSPQRLRPWLYALVRTECGRRSPATPRTADAHDTAPDSTELRSLAWKASEAAPESEALQLHVRHGIEHADLAAILGRQSGEVHTLLNSARIRVGQALRAEMLARTGPASCTTLVALLPRTQEHLDDEEWYERVDRHARSCATCSERVPRRVSVSRLMGLLPPVVPPADLRQRVIEAYAEPRLLEYRLLTARRLRPLRRNGFPVQRGSARCSSRKTPALAIVGGLMAASLCAVASLAVLRYASFAADAWAGVQHPRSHIDDNTDAGLGFPPATPTGWGADANMLRSTDAGPSGGGDADGHKVAKSPQSSPRGSSGTVGTVGTRPSFHGQLRVSTHRLHLGANSHGDVTLHAVDGPARWDADLTTSCLRAAPSAGGIAAGNHVTITLTVARDSQGCGGPGAGTVNLTGRGLSVRVSWSQSPTTPSNSTGSASNSSSPSPPRSSSDTSPSDPRSSQAPSPSPSGSEPSGPPPSGQTTHPR